MSSTVEPNASEGQQAPLAVRERPEVILVGDSHTLALAQGCEALGIRAAMLKSGGIHWNGDAIRVFAARRNRSPILPNLRRDLKALENTLGTSNVFDGSVPVIASIGFHTGHLTRAFGAFGHVAWPPSAASSESWDESARFASSAVVGAFVQARRAHHFWLLRSIAQRCRLTVIFPPRAPKNEKKYRFRHNIDALTNEISRRMEALGIDLYDPNADFVGPGELLPWEWVLSDGFHGTPEYGKVVMERLLARNALAPNTEQGMSDR